MGKKEMLRQLLAKLDEAIVFREKTVTPEDRAEACEIVGSLKAKIIHL